MGRLDGYFEWDNDDLRPGQKREGGLHQNLYDDEGKLKGSARFIPKSGGESDPIVVTETMYVTVEQRRRSPEQEAPEQAITDLISHWIDRGIARAKPIAAQWWRETARPALAAQRAKISARRGRRDAGTVEMAETNAPDQPGELADAAVEDRPVMSRAEGQARYLAALAARAYSDEQMRLVTSANIVDGGGVAELTRSLAELPPDQVRSLIEAMATDPAMLSEDTLAQLASVLGRHPGRAVPDRSPKPVIPPSRDPKR